MYKNIFITHQELVRKMVEHPAMAPNLEQTFSTPANSKNKVCVIVTNIEAHSGFSISALPGRVHNGGGH
jgi:hypothetical protein